MRCLAPLVLAGLGAGLLPLRAGDEGASKMLDQWELIRTSEGQKHQIAIVALADHGPAAVPLLMEMWGRGSGGDAVALSAAIRKIKPDSKHVLADFCKSVRADPDPEVRQFAAVTLGQLQLCDDTVPSLIVGLKDKTPMVVYRSAIALREIGPPAKAACPALAEVAKAIIDKSELGNDCETAGHALYALANIDPTTYRDLILRLSGELIRRRKEPKIGTGWLAASTAVQTLPLLDGPLKERMALILEYAEDPTTPKELRQWAIEAAKRLLEK